MRAEDGRGFTTRTGRISISSGARPNHQPSTPTSEKVVGMQRISPGAGLRQKYAISVA